MLRVGIIGVGTVGASVANILRDNKNIITARAGKEIVPTIGVVSNLHKTRNVDIKLTDNIDDVLNMNVDENITTTIYSMEGKYILSKKHKLNVGQNTLTYDLKKNMASVYLIKLEGKTINKLIKIKLELECK